MFSSWQNWKIASTGALLGLAGTLFATREPVVTVRQVMNGPARSRATVQGWVEVREPNRFVLHDDTGTIRLEDLPRLVSLPSLAPRRAGSRRGRGGAPRSVARRSAGLHRLPPPPRVCAEIPLRLP